MNTNRPENTVPDRDSAKIRFDANLLLIFGVTLMVVMGVSSIIPAFPEIVRELDISDRKVGLLISFFALPGVFFAPIMGVIADRWGRKKLLVPSLLLFGTAGGACAFVENFNVMLFLRCCQGIGASTLGTLNVTILSDLYTGNNRTAVLGYNMSVLSVGTAIYPAMGGALALYGWRYPFMLPFFAIPLGILVIFFLKNPEPKNKQKFNEYIGNVMKSVKNKQTIGLFALGIVTFLVLYGSFLTCLPLLLDKSFGASSLTIGLIMSSVSVTTALTSTKIGFITRITSRKVALITAFILYTLSLLMIPFVSALWGFLIPAVIFGFGMGLAIPCIQSLLTEMAPIKYRAAFMSINNMVLRIGQTLGPVLMFFLLTAGGIEGVFYTGAGLSILMIVITRIMIHSENSYTTFYRNDH
ncbi:MFS transporter [Candidatus Latescibacterota bacterium]